VAGHDASSVFLYDTDLDITWLRDANVNGLMNWADANAWANSISLGAFSGWRLPSVTDSGSIGCNHSYSGGTDCGYNVDIDTGEMAHLFHDELGNLAVFDTSGTSRSGVSGVDFGLVNVGDFRNMQPSVYWSGTEYAALTDYAWGFSTGNGGQNFGPKNAEFYAMAVRPGDVLAAQVPEPESLVLALTALGALALVRRRRAVGSSAL
jgi:hypothetical protein